jgi:hypothetical protein
MILFTRKELEALGKEFNLPWRQLSEAQQVLLHEGLPPKEIKTELRRLCSNANDQGGGVQIFNNVLLGFVAILRAENS